MKGMSSAGVSRRPRSREQAGDVEPAVDPLSVASCSISKIVFLAISAQRLISGGWSLISPRGSAALCPCLVLRNACRNEGSEGGSQVSLFPPCSSGQDLQLQF